MSSISLIKTIQKNIAKSINLQYKISLHPKDVLIKVQPGSKMGCIATPIALQISKRLNKEVKEAANVIKDTLMQMQEIDTCNIAPNGFVNCTLQNQYILFNVLHKIDNYDNKSLANLKVMVEYTDPNPFKALHIGHLYTNMIGESLARLYESAGAEVKRANYQGDVGMHVAKAIWGILNLTSNDNDFDKVHSLPLSDRVRFLAKAYALGAGKYKEDKNAQKEIKEINRMVYIASQEMLSKEGFKISVDYQQDHKINKDLYKIVKKIYFAGRRWSLDDFETFYKKMGTKFDFYFFEGQTAEYGLRLVMEGFKKGIFIKDQGAIIFPGKRYGLHNRVFINSLGLPTYEAKDLGLMKLKYEKYNYDTSVIITANEIDEYFKVVFKAMEFLNKELREKNIHISHGFVRLSTGKMSSRTGKVIYGNDVLNRVEEKIEKIVKQSLKVPKDKIKETVEKLTVATVKYGFLKYEVGKDIVFNFDSEVNIKGNTGIYLQYAFARISSILEKATKIDLYNKAVLKYTPTGVEKELVELLFFYPYWVQAAIQNLKPNIICQYAYTLATAFNKFYEKYDVLKAREDTKAFRIALLRSLQSVLKHSFNLLGFEPVYKM